MEPDKAMPSMDAMLTIEYTPRQWLTFYKNVWTRNLMACITDVQADRLLKAANPLAETPDLLTNENGHPLIGENGKPKRKLVAQRLEERKNGVQNSLDILASLDSLLALSEDDLAKTWADEALKPEAVPAAKVDDTKLVSFTVADGKTLTTDDKIDHAAGTTVDLDPDAQATKDWVTAGVIAPTRAI